MCGLFGRSLAEADDARYVAGRDEISERGYRYGAGRGGVRDRGDRYGQIAGSP
ncbi:hypothetical protein OMR58_15650 [Erwinia sp. INIA-01]|uniref:hypothetical protein n=1 Tax=Erwinia sp. INIA01 TaxID=2991500 RepID=UPI0022257DE5|nr:hypothetical protein [Erwinia sp. INIA01]MCW1875885.1 hypothetical protein [Erwinia sp. INIA01]